MDLNYRHAHLEMLGTTHNQEYLKNLEEVVRRRQIFRKHITDEFMNELSDFLGVSDSIFAFRSEKGAPFDPYLAAQRDALMGVVRGLAYEADHLEEAEEELAAFKKQIEEEN